MTWTACSTRNKGPIVHLFTS